jgi:hypothetical protein
VVAAVAVSVAGCVGMPNSGSPGTFGAAPQDNTPDSDFIGAIPAGPEPNWSPTEIVTGFLNASNSYPAYKAIAREYLASTGTVWDPRWSVTVVDQVNVPDQADYSRGDRQALVDVTGGVQASFDGSGQYVGALQSQNRGAAQEAHWPFKLVKVNGHWRITNPPPFRMLTEPDFVQVYKPQDLYFFDPAGQVLVPDAVFVPAGASPTSLVSNLVTALLNDPQTPWLKNGTTPSAVTEFPDGTKIINVTVDGTTATVNLGGAAASADNTTLGQISAQLVWTLTGQQQGSLSIQAVQLEIKGQAWTPSAPCAGAGRNSQSPAQKLAMYGCYNPYPVAKSSAFYYVGGGQAWFRCASESQVMTGSIGPVVPVFNRTSAPRLDQECGDSVQAQSKVMPPPQPRSLPPLSMVAVSPDGKYVAGVVPSKNVIDVWTSGGTKLSSSLPASGVTAIAWDRSDSLWMAQNGITSVVAPAGDGFTRPQISGDFGGKISGLGIAPDGVRVAAVVQTPSGNELELAAIDRNVPASGKLEQRIGNASIGQTVRLGPNVANPIALTWYDADDLLVLDGTGSGAALWAVPVDGQPATKSPGVLPGAVSITANSAQNALVVGLSGGQMEVSASLDGPWQTLGSGGQNPAFPVPAFPAPAPS